MEAMDAMSLSIDAVFTMDFEAARNLHELGVRKCGRSTADVEALKTFSKAIQVCVNRL
jgi:hypothetical protein